MRKNQRYEKLWGSNKSRVVTVNISFMKRARSMQWSAQAQSSKSSSSQCSYKPKRVRGVIWRWRRVTRKLSRFIKEKESVKIDKSSDVGKGEHMERCNGMMQWISPAKPSDSKSRIWLKALWIFLYHKTHSLCYEHEHAACESGCAVKKQSGQDAWWRSAAASRYGAM